MVLNKAISSINTRTIHKTIEKFIEKYDYKTELQLLAPLNYERKRVFVIERIYFIYKSICI